MKFKEFLKEETLSPGQETKFKKLGTEVNYKERYKELFGTEDRIYLPIKDEKIKVGIDDTLRRTLELIYTSDVVKKDNESFHKMDIKNGTFTYKLGKEERIVNITDAIKDYFKSSGSGNKKEEALTLNMFKSSPLRIKGTINKFNIVISRNPCDIAGMSTNRGWRSCMNLYTGSMNRYVDSDIKEGTLIAYLIDEKDKNIDYPLGRILIKPYISSDGKQKYLKMAERSYGTFTDEAREVVKKWLKRNQKNIKGTFLFPHGKLYRDTDDPREIRIGIRKTKKLNK